MNVRRYDQLRRLGVNMLAVEYPGFGGVAGRASEAGMHAAAAAAYDHLRRVEDDQVEAARREVVSKIAAQRKKSPPPLENH